MLFSEINTCSSGDLSSGVLLLVVTSTFQQRARDSACNHRVAGKLACQAQNDRNVEEHSPSNLFVSGRSPTYTFRWLDVRETLAGLTFEAKKVHWPMSHFSFCFTSSAVNDPYFLIPILWQLKKKKGRTPTVQILYSFPWPGGKLLQEKSWIFFFFPFRSERKCQVLSNPSISPSSEARIPRALGWESESFHMWANHTLKFYEAPLCRKKGPLPLKLLASTERHLLPEANWECSCEALLSSPLF